jgi:UDPglucose 6-dehydrogenase
MKHLSLKLLSEIVVSRRKVLKLSQAELSKRANINRSILSRLEMQDYSNDPARKDSSL